MVAVIFDMDVLNIKALLADPIYSGRIWHKVNF